MGTASCHICASWHGPQNILHQQMEEGKSEILTKEYSFKILSLKKAAFALQDWSSQ